MSLIGCLMDPPRLFCASASLLLFNIKLLIMESQSFGTSSKKIIETEETEKELETP